MIKKHTLCSIFPETIHKQQLDTNHILFSSATSNIEQRMLGDRGELSVAHLLQYKNIGYSVSPRLDKTGDVEGWTRDYSWWDLFITTDVGDSAFIDVKTMSIDVPTITISKNERNFLRRTVDEDGPCIPIVYPLFYVVYRDDVSDKVLNRVGIFSALEVYNKLRPNKDHNGTYYAFITDLE